MSRLKAQCIAAASLVYSLASAQTVHPMGDVFDTPPKAASAKGKASCQVAQKYVDNVNAGRYQDQGTLFADDAVFVRPDGKVSRGAKEMGDFYKNFLGMMVPTIIPISFIADGSECVMELAAITKLGGEEKYKLGAIDHFTVNKAGKIQHMVVFVRPDSIEAQKKAQ